MRELLHKIVHTAPPPVVSGAIWGLLVGTMIGIALEGKFG